MTDNEIIKALEGEIHLAEYADSIFADNVSIKLLKGSLDLINRQKAEIERLKKERDMAVKDIYCSTKCFICKNMPSDGNMTHCPNYSSCGLAYIHFRWRGENNGNL